MKYFGNIIQHVFQKPEKRCEIFSQQLEIQFLKAFGNVCVRIKSYTMSWEFGGYIWLQKTFNVFICCVLRNFQQKFRKMVENVSIWGISAPQINP